MKRLLAIACLFLSIYSYGQVNLARQALEKIEKKQWAESKNLLKKAWKKDSASSALYYAYARLFFSPAYFDFSIDSAHHFAQIASSTYFPLSLRDRQKFRKLPLDSVILTKLLSQIDSVAFEKAKLTGTETSYIHFIARYPKSPQINQALELRDEAAFVDALKENKHSAFQNFLRKYPRSHRSSEAKQRYEKLLYDFSTKEKSLTEYKKFVNDHPTSPHTPEAIDNIFMLETESGDPENFEQFIRFYPNTPQSKRASAILFHLLPQLQQATMLNDSLKKIYPLREWIPFHQEHGWGFLDESGKVMLTGLPELNEKYFCGPLKDDFIITSENIVGRNGALIRLENFTDVMDIGAGYLLATNNQKGALIHKSGWLADFPVVDNATMVNNRFVAVQQEKLWALFTLTGKQLTPFLFDALEARGQFLIASRASKKLLIGFNNLLPFTKETYEPLVADEIKRYGSEYFWMRNGALEQVIDENLNVIIPFGRHSISFNALGLVITQNNLTTLYNWPSLNSIKLAHVSVAEPWLITRNSGEKSSLHYIPIKQLTQHQADSIWFDQSLAITKHGDSIRLWQSGDRFISLPTMENYKLRLSKDSILFVLISGKTKTTVYEAASFRKVFASAFLPEPILKNFFLYESAGKQGLLDGKGKIIMSAEYDAILYNNGIFSLLKNKQFGSYHPQSKKLIKPTFDSNLRSFGNNWLITRKKEKWGFLNLEGKTHTLFEFDEIEFWNDSLAIVKKAGKQWMYSIPRKKVKVDELSSLEKIGSNTEQLGIFRQQGSYGLLSSDGEVLMPAKFEELTWQEVNGTLLFIGLKPAEQEMRQVIYFTSSGKVVHRIITTKEAAYMLLCD